MTKFPDTCALYNRAVLALRDAGYKRDLNPGHWWQPGAQWLFIVKVVGKKGVSLAMGNRHRPIDKQAVDRTFFKEGDPDAMEGIALYVASWHFKNQIQKP